MMHALITLVFDQTSHEFGTWISTAKKPFSADVITYPSSDSHLPVLHVMAYVYEDGYLSF